MIKACRYDCKLRWFLYYLSCATNSDVFTFSRAPYSCAPEIFSDTWNSRGPMQSLFRYRTGAVVTSHLSLFNTDILGQVYRVSAHPVQWDISWRVRATTLPLHPPSTCSTLTSRSLSVMSYRLYRSRVVQYVKSRTLSRRNQVCKGSWDSNVWRDRVVRLHVMVQRPTDDI